MVPMNTFQTRDVRKRYEEQMEQQRQLLKQKSVNEVRIKTDPTLFVDPAVSPVGVRKTYTRTVSVTDDRSLTNKVLGMLAGEHRHRHKSSNNAELASRACQSNSKDRIRLGKHFACDEGVAF
jgi:uncharacterized membrane protein